MATHPDSAQVWQWLAEVPDPEIPVISITDLGIVRSVAHEGETLVVSVTPTYSGCPATGVISLEIDRKLREHGVENLEIRRQLSPPWTSDWLSADARERLRRYGIAPPVDGAAAGQVAGRVRRLAGQAPVVACPRCGAKETERVSAFGSTPCKAAYRCRSCLEPFDYFKCI